MCLLFFLKNRRHFLANPINFQFYVSLLNLNVHVKTRIWAASLKSNDITLHRKYSSVCYHRAETHVTKRAWALEAGRLGSLTSCTTLKVYFIEPQLLHLYSGDLNTFLRMAGRKGLPSHYVYHTKHCKTLVSLPYHAPSIPSIQKNYTLGTY